MGYAQGTYLHNALASHKFTPRYYIAQASCSPFACHRGAPRVFLLRTQSLAPLRWHQQDRPPAMKKELSKDQDIKGY